MNQLRQERHIAPLERVERAAHKHDQARANLEAAMKAAADAGIPLRPIATASGFSRERVRQLIAAQSNVT